MPEIRAFKAIRYDFNRNGGDLSNVIAPPYDVLNEADKKALLAKSADNIVMIDLPHIPPKEEGPQQVYVDAQFNLDMWLNTGTLVREEKPALYLYHQTFEHEGKQTTRRMFIAAMRLHAFEEGVVLPHEKTFGGPKADRLALTKETQCNISPVFGLYTDPEDVIGQAFAETAKRKPDATAKLEGVLNEVWVVTEPSVIDAVRAAMADKKVFIADGHHRYTTALTYRDMVAGHKEISADHPANRIMIVLASMDDPGCVIQGYCRVLEDVTAEALLSVWSAGVETCSESDSESNSERDSESAADLALYDGTSKATTTLKFTNRSILDELAPERDASWRKLDVAYLHTYLLDKLAAEAMGQSPKIRYVKSIHAARKAAEESGGVAIIPNATPMAHLRAVSEAGELMPQKSTFFYPKLATGLTIHSLVPDA